MAVVGRPNAGKSTLTNALVGRKVAIVSDKPQTTRRRLLGFLTEARGQLVFVDTPGLHKPFHRLNRAMLHEALEAIREVDVRVLVIDGSVPEGGGDRYTLELLEESPAPRIAVLNKIDAMKKNAILPRIAALAQTGLFEEIVPISALSGDGVDRLTQVLFAHVPEGEDLYPDAELTLTSDEVRYADLLREKLLERTREEIPYGLGVVIEEIERKPERDVTVVMATIVVDKENHKKIVLGRGGALLKEAATAARLEMETTFGGRFFLDLNVAARPGWREDPRFLPRLTS